VVERVMEVEEKAVVATAMVAAERGAGAMAMVEAATATVEVATAVVATAMVAAERGAGAMAMVEEGRAAARVPLGTCRALARW
jgi:hypothetical protein